MSKSVYILEISIQPGGARRGEFFVYTRWEDLQRVLEWEFLSAQPERRSMSAYLAVWYGEQIAIWVVQNGTVNRAIDLHPFIRVRLAGRPAVLLDDPRLREIFDEIEEANEDAEDSFDLPAEFEVDLEGIRRALPALEGTVLGKGESITVVLDATVRTEVAAKNGSYLGAVGEEIAYGYTDAESGEDPPPEFADDSHDDEGE